MKKSWRLIPKILSGEKTIESRWYQTKRAPWDKAKAGDTIFFKNSSEPIIAQATISAVKQFEIDSRNDLERIIKAYGREICLVETNPDQWAKPPKYCILLWLEKPRPINPPVIIDKTGFGNAAAWLIVKNLSQIKAPK